MELNDINNIEKICRKIVESKAELPIKITDNTLTSLEGILKREGLVIWFLYCKLTQKIQKIIVTKISPDSEEDYPNPNFYAYPVNLRSTHTHTHTKTILKQGKSVIG